MNPVLTRSLRLLALLSILCWTSLNFGCAAAGGSGGGGNGGDEELGGADGDPTDTAEDEGREVPGDPEPGEGDDGGAGPDLGGAGEGDDEPTLPTGDDRPGDEPTQPDPDGDPELPGEEPDEPDFDDPDPDPAAAADLLVPGYAAPAELVEYGVTYTSLAVQAVFGATFLSGATAPVTTGTLTQTVPNTLNFTYSATPTDRLRVELADGQSGEFVIHTINGEDLSSAQNFLDGDHELDFEVLVPDTLDMRFTSNQARNSPISFERTRRQTAVGTFLYDGIIYTANLTADSTVYFENDTTGAEFRTSSVTTGTIDAPGWSMNLDETWEYTSVTTGGATADTSLRRLNNSWSTGGSTYRFNNAVIRTSLRDGRPTQWETFWLAEGELLRDGAAYGYLELTAGLSGLTAYLVLPGERIELQSWG